MWLPISPGLIFRELKRPASRPASRDLAQTAEIYYEESGTVVATLVCMKILTLALVLALTTAAGCEAGAGDPVGDSYGETIFDNVPEADAGDGYQDEPGTLSQSLTLRDTQFGFLGATGTEVNVSENGEWSKFQIIGTVRTEIQSGVLSALEMDLLADSLNRLSFLELNDQFGEVDAIEGANPHYVSMAFGNTQKTLVLRPGVSMSAYFAGLDNEDPMSTVVGEMMVVEGVLALAAAQ